MGGTTISHDRVIEKSRPGRSEEMGSKKKRKKGKRARRLSPEMVKTLEKQKEAFRRKFGRDPGPEDPLFFDRNADTPQPLDMDETMALVVEAMAKARVEPARIYAYRKTGLIVTEENLHLLSEQDLAEWEAANRNTKR